MDLAQTLVRSVMRAFYDTKHILVVDALIIHSALRDDDLAYLMGMNTKELHKLCGKLREDRFLAVHARPETKEGQTRPINRTYYYIDYRATIDAIKWRVYLIDKKVQGTTIKKEDRKAYLCPRCKSQWTQLEVLDNISAQGFLCHKCQYILVPNTEANQGGHEQSTKLNAQFKFMTNMLPRIDQVVIPDNNFEVAFAAAVPVQRDALLNPASATTPMDVASSRPLAVKGLENTGPTSISVTVTSSDGPTEAERNAEQARRAAAAAQNALPTHFTHSTITGEQVNFNNAPTDTLKLSPDESKDKKDVLSTLNDGEGISAISDSYFEQLKAEQARQILEEQEEEFETDDEEEDGEDEFEDVAPASSAVSGSVAQSAAATPASSGAEVRPLISAMKRKSSSPGSSGISTAAPSPANGPGTPDSGRMAKKVRIEEPSPAKAEVESEEDDVEFEDV